MDHPQEVLDLSIVFTPPPPDSSPEILAHVAIQCDTLGLSHTGEIFTDPLVKAERDDLHWYLEEYWQWPYLGFAERGRRVETLLDDVGRRFYQALFGSREAHNIVQAWQQQVNVQHQISIVSDIAGILRLPWELLADSQSFLVLHTDPPISMVRRIPRQGEQASLTTPFQLPLRVLLVTARPEGAGFIDPRNISRELVDELQGQAETGTIELEFLRPPTFTALSNRLGNTDRPIHVLHFDGHGGLGGKKQQGVLLFEDKGGKPSAVEASDLAKVLKNSGVRLVVLTACQSAMGTKEDDAFSSVSTQLINKGVGAVIAMSSSILVTTAARYVEAFYNALAGGLLVSTAQEQARQALQRDPYRHLFRRSLDEEGERVRLSDWWVPHFYQQHPVLFQLAPSHSTNAQPLQTLPVRYQSSEMPTEPRYGFNGRARELQQIERHLLQRKVVVLHGFGGIGKTTLAREAADWLTRTRMYDRACFISFEHIGDPAWLLGELGRCLNISDGNYHPDDTTGALTRLKPLLEKRRTLVIVDNLESILPGGDVPLEQADLDTLWETIFALREIGAGVLLTTRNTSFGESWPTSRLSSALLPLQGLQPDDAYTFASRLLITLGIDRTSIPYTDLRDLLVQLDHHPLAIQLVLPALRTIPLATIHADFIALLPLFTDDQETGRNRSLLASLDYSLRRLSEAQRAQLPRLALFDGGASEDDLLAITEIAESDWAELRRDLEQVSLLTVEKLKGLNSPFLHFHPILIPFLRGEAKAQDEALMARYTQQYYQASGYYFGEDQLHPMQIRPIVQRELPNLRRAFGYLVESGGLEQVVPMAGIIGSFLTFFGLHREQQRINQRVAGAFAASKQSATGALTLVEYLHESNLGEEEQREGQFQAARARFQQLLARIESQPEGTPLLGPGSLGHVGTLGRLGRCLEAEGNYASAESLYRRALVLSEALVQHDPEDQDLLREQGTRLADLGDALRYQGLYEEAKKAHEQALQIKERMGELRAQATSQESLGAIALEQGDYPEARKRYHQALQTFHALGEPTVEALAWHQLGRVNMGEQNWPEAERCLRESLMLREQLGDRVGVAQTCTLLGVVAENTNRFVEAKGWYQRVIQLSQQADPASRDHATYLYNLAYFLVKEILAGKTQDVSHHLEEARGYMEQALTIYQVLQISVPWRIFALLAGIAKMQGRDEEAQAFHWKEKEAYASFAGNRYWIDQHFGRTLFPAFAAAQDNPEIRAQGEEVLPQLEAKGWHVSSALRRVWAGERDWQGLVENLGNDEALFILRVLETLGEGQDTTTNDRSPE